MPRYRFLQGARGRAGPSLPRKWRLSFLTFWLTCIWIGEIGIFYIYYGRCSSSYVLNTQTNDKTDSPDSNVMIPKEVTLKETFANKSHHDLEMAIIADPQLTDRYSYKQHGVALILTQFYSDLYIQRAFSALVTSVKPTLYLYLGDLLDGGREWVDSEYFDEMLRLRRIFGLSQSRPGFFSSSKDENVFYVAGNHDIGFGSTTVFSAAKRFMETFQTDLNYVVRLPNHIIVVVNTMALEDKASSDMRQKTLRFLASLEDLWANPSYKNSQRLLFTHVPLFRPENSDCGPLRTSRTIHQANGYQFQNLISPENTGRVLRAVQPSFVFSGDDHDQCEYVHEYGDKKATEHTVGTFSWLQGNPYPSVGLLNLQRDGQIKYRVCFLPPQLRTYIFYIVAFLFTAIYICLFALPVYYYGWRPATRSLLSIVIPSVFWYIFLLAWTCIFNLTT